MAQLPVIQYTENSSHNNGITDIDSEHVQYI